MLVDMDETVPGYVRVLVTCPIFSDRHCRMIPGDPLHDYAGPPQLLRLCCQPGRFVVRLAFLRAGVGPSGSTSTHMFTLLRWESDRRTLRPGRHCGSPIFPDGFTAARRTVNALLRSSVVINQKCGFLLASIGI